MPWVSRRGRRYFYKAVRSGGRALSIYLGCGPAAEEAAAEVEQRRQARQRARAVLQAEIQQRLAVLAALEQLSALADLLAQATLVAAGYHQHHRGEWRRRRAQASPARPAAVRG
jgi:cysteine sulfinate desulfinase/cysteine desulfurase-like protein